MAVAKDFCPIDAAIAVIYPKAGKKVGCTIHAVSFCRNWQKIGNSTWDSQAVTHPSTNQAQHCLTAVIRRELVCSMWCGRCLITGQRWEKAFARKHKKTRKKHPSQKSTPHSCLQCVFLGCWTYTLLKLGENLLKWAPMHIL